MGKPIDKIKEKINLFIYKASDDPALGFNLKEGAYFKELFALETPTHRIAIVRKKAKLPRMLVDADVAHIVRNTKQAMLDARFVQEERE